MRAGEGDFGGRDQLTRSQYALLKRLRILGADHLLICSSNLLPRSLSNAR